MKSIFSPSIIKELSKARYSLLVLSFFLFSINQGFSQTTYNSSMTTNYKPDSESIKKPRIISVSDTEIIISDYKEGAKPLKIKVNKIEEKEDDLDGISMMKWYYCSNIDKNPITGKNTEYVVVMKKQEPSVLELYQKINEVTFAKSFISLR